MYHIATKWNFMVRRKLELSYIITCPSPFIKYIDNMQDYEKSKYRLYIDEVGNPDVEASENYNHRFLSLTGVIFESDYVKYTVHPCIERLKIDTLNYHPDDKPIILHRKEIINAKHPFTLLANDENRDKFNEQLIRLLGDLNYTVISVCLDKKRHKETYSTWLYDPYHYCLALMLERYIFFLEQNNFIGDVMAEARGKKEDRRLGESFTRLYMQGTDYLSAERFQESLTSKKLKIKPKDKNISGLQIADLIAHPSRNEILNDNGLLKKPLSPFGKIIETILKDKYYQRDGNIYGKKFI
jgi:hypothetical protein